MAFYKQEINGLRGNC